MCWPVVQWSRELKPKFLVCFDYGSSGGSRKKNKGWWPVVQWSRELKPKILVCFDYGSSGGSRKKNKGWWPVVQWSRKLISKMSLWISIGPPWRIDPTIHRTMSGQFPVPLGSRGFQPKLYHWFGGPLLRLWQHIVMWRPNLHLFRSCSSVVRAFAHGAMDRRIDPSWSGPIELFLVRASAPRLV